MAFITLPNFSLFCVLLAVSILLLSSSATAQPPNVEPKLSNFRFYWHDITGGQNPTSITIIKPAANHTTGFGSVQMIDDPLTLDPSLESEELGRAQGLYGGVSLEKLSLIMMMNFVFTTGNYSGSTITIMGSNSVMDKVREMSVVGGSGVFRFARGYARAQTCSIDAVDAVVQYDVSVMY